ncbi:MAG: cytochrome-c peroxidase [Chloroflexi bacterium AL-W]|nr:cytochrome-c peroxidase [Chloroflexi bacterium AL-N1]NOK67382.1 cytochrome-c peroxidase [Chloroflexi bacterium AL-N10]NOK75126.1 cytochrome-c peroxidase [Chloroflexi bacterium AL-N5]NOK81913.1 cytochrome-c peroxidase [Chloroflexi bacterium AL-W]NOK89759.1 cytochrome-c peroxidase [Chloroflexi bacterium AL-N15]
MTEREKASQTEKSAEQGVDTTDSKSLSRRLLIGAASLVVLVIVGISVYAVWPRGPQWTDSEVTLLRSLWIGELAPPPADPSNAVVDDPRAVAFGEELFFDESLSVDGSVSCATCHDPDQSFTDGLAFSEGVGVTGRSAPTVIGTAYSDWFFWDGRKDSMWSQALGPLESPVEHGGARTFYVRIIDQEYRVQYEELFGELPDFSDQERFPDNAAPLEDPASSAAWAAMTEEDRDSVNRVFANMGKAISAYQRQIEFGPSRFDQYVEAVVNNDNAAMRAALTPEEEAGLRVFIGDGKCMTCHLGPLMTDNRFYNLDVPSVEGQDPDRGRAVGIQQVAEDEFNCLGRYSDAAPEDCEHLEALDFDDPDIENAMRTVTIRNIAETAPYMHAGQLQTLEEVVEHYNVWEEPGREIDLTEEQKAQLVAFLRSLSSEVILPDESGETASR